MFVDRGGFVSCFHCKYQKNMMLEANDQTTLLHPGPNYINLKYGCKVNNIILVIKAEGKLVKDFT